jgi:hypothetical protein
MGLVIHSSIHRFRFSCEPAVVVTAHCFVSCSFSQQAPSPNCGWRLNALHLCAEIHKSVCSSALFQADSGDDTARRIDSIMKPNSHQLFERSCAMS